MGGVFAFYSIVYGIVVSFMSLLIGVACAAIASVKNKKTIWAWGVCVQTVCLVYLLIEHYVDGAHYKGPFVPIAISLVCLFIVACLSVIVFKTNSQRWKTMMWVFSFIIPICVFVFCVDLDLDLRPYTQKQLESMIDITLPKYEVMSYEEHSPGGDDWECNSCMRIKKNSDLEAFRVALEDKCHVAADELSESESDCMWNKTSEVVYYCRKQFDIERFLQMEFDINNRIISYKYLKI